MTKLDYTIDSPQERLKLVEQILEENPEPTEAYLESLTKYLVLCMEKQEKKEKKILTENRMSTVNKRETSFEGLVSQLENGEDGIYNLMNESKTTIFQPKVTITKKDLEEIEPLRQIRDAINWWEAKSKTAVGRDAYICKKAVIELRKDQYTVKNAYRRPITFARLTRNKSFKKIDDDYKIDNNGGLHISGISLANPKVVSAILCNYSRLKEDSWGQLEGDLYYLMWDFDDLCTKALKDYPIYEKIVELKIDGLQNVDIQKELEDTFGVKHSLEYISSLWRNKIPNIIASVEEDEILYNHYFIKEKGKYKKCSRCGEIKLAHNKYFSKNKTSKDGFYSICKCCRNTKDKKVKN